MPLRLGSRSSASTRGFCALQVGHHVAAMWTMTGRPEATALSNAARSNVHSPAPAPADAATRSSADSVRASRAMKPEGTDVANDTFAADDPSFIDLALSDAAIPLVAFVFPVATLAAADAGETVDQLNGANVLGLLVAELAFDPAADRRAIDHRQRMVVEIVGEEGLRMVRLVKVDALVVPRVVAVERRPVHRIEAAEDDELRFRLRPGLVEHEAERHALPFADTAPAFDAIVPRDLRSRRHGAQLPERELARRLDQTDHLQAVVGEARLAQRLVVGVHRVERAVAAKGRRDVALAELLRHRRPRRHDLLRGVAEPLRALERLDEARVVRKPVAACQHGRADRRHRAAQQVPAVALARPNERVGLRILHERSSFLAWSTGTRYQPVIIERISFQTPATNTSKTCTRTKSTRPNAAMRCSERADCRPPSRSTQPVKTVSMRGESAMPASTTSGRRPKMTMRYARLCSTL